MEIEIKPEASILRVQAGDVVLVRAKPQITREQAQRLGEVVSGAFRKAGCVFEPEILVVDAGTDISVLRTAPDAPQGEVKP